MPNERLTSNLFEDENDIDFESTEVEQDLDKKLSKISNLLKKTNKSLSDNSEADSYGSIRNIFVQACGFIDDDAKTDTTLGKGLGRPDISFSPTIDGIKYNCWLAIEVKKKALSSAEVAEVLKEKSKYAISTCEHLILWDGHKVYHWRIIGTIPVFSDSFIWNRENWSQASRAVYYKLQQWIGKERFTGGVARLLRGELTPELAPTTDNGFYYAVSHACDSLYMLPPVSFEPFWRILVDPPKVAGFR